MFSAITKINAPTSSHSAVSQCSMSSRLRHQVEGDCCNQGTGAEPGQPADHPGGGSHPIDDEPGQDQRRLGQPAQGEGF